MMRTQNTHAPSSRLNAVAPFVNAYPCSAVAVIWGDGGVAFAIPDVMPIRDSALVRRNSRLVIIAFLFSMVDAVVFECSFHYIKKCIVTDDVIDIR